MTASTAALAVIVPRGVAVAHGRQARRAGEARVRNHRSRTSAAFIKMQPPAAVDDNRDRGEHDRGVRDRGSQRCRNSNRIDQHSRIVTQRIDDDQDADCGDAELIDFGGEQRRRSRRARAPANCRVHLFQSCRCHAGMPPRRTA
jgi:hypothetical protein